MPRSKDLGDLVPNKTCQIKLLEILSMLNHVIRKAGYKILNTDQEMWRCPSWSCSVESIYFITACLRSRTFAAFNTATSKIQNSTRPIQTHKQFCPPTTLTKWPPQNCLSIDRPWFLTRMRQIVCQFELQGRISPHRKLGNLTQIALDVEPWLGPHGNPCDVCQTNVGKTNLRVQTTCGFHKSLSIYNQTNYLECPQHNPGALVIGIILCFLFSTHIFVIIRHEKGESTFHRLQSTLRIRKPTGLGWYTD